MVAGAARPTGPANGRFKRVSTTRVGSEGNELRPPVPAHEVPGDIEHEIGRGPDRGPPDEAEGAVPASLTVDTRRRGCRLAGRSPSRSSECWDPRDGRAMKASAAGGIDEGEVARHCQRPSGDSGGSAGDLERASDLRRKPAAQTYAGATVEDANRIERGEGRT